MNRSTIPRILKSTSVLLFGMIGLSSAASGQSLYSDVGVDVAGKFGELHHDDDGLGVEVNFGADHFQGFAEGKAQFGSLHTYASATNYGQDAYSWAVGEASFTDKVTIDIPGLGAGSGLMGYYMVDFTVDGHFLNQSVGGEAGVRLTWTNAPNGVPGGVLDGTHTYHGVIAMPFTYGVPFDLTADMFTQADFAYGGSGFIAADFYNTAKLSAFHVYNQDWLEVPGDEYTVTAASGTRYPKGAVPVPEPATSGALALGLLGLIRRYRRTKS